MLDFSGYNLLTLFWCKTSYTCDGIGKSISLKNEHRSPENYNRDTVRFGEITLIVPVAWYNEAVPWSTCLLPLPWCHL